jgi:hypothetical protein
MHNINRTIKQEEKFCTIDEVCVFGAVSFSKNLAATLFFEKSSMLG